MVVESVYDIFESLIKRLNLVGSKPVFHKNYSLNDYFFNDKLLNKYEKLIDKHLFNEGLDLSIGNIMFDSYSSDCEKINECICLESRFDLLIILFNKLFNQSSNSVIPEFEKELKRLFEEFGFSKPTFEAVLAFYRNNHVSDTENSVYFVKSDFNLLTTANGVKCIRTEEQNILYYLKYIPETGAFLCKKIRDRKIYSQITNEIVCEEIALLSLSNFNSYLPVSEKFYDIVAFAQAPVKAEAIEVESKESLPHIKLDPDNALIIIDGVSTPISPLTYLEPILSWMDLYLRYNNELNIDFNLAYFNTYTTKFLLKLIEKCNYYLNRNKKIKIYWNYSENDDDLKESGELYKSMFQDALSFSMIVNN